MENNTETGMFQYHFMMFQLNSTHEEELLQKREELQGRIRGLCFQNFYMYVKFYFYCLHVHLSANYTLLRGNETELGKIPVI